MYSKKASIIIPVFNGIDMTLECLESIKTFTKIPHEIIVVDNASTDGTQKKLSSHPCVKYIRSKENLGFAGGCNLGITAAVGEYIILSNNDILFTPEWLPRLISAAEVNDRIGLVGPLTNKAAGAHVEVLFEYDLGEGLIRHSEEIYKKNHSLITEVPFLIFFLVLIKRKVLEKIGLLDSSLGLGGSDDIDFSFRSNKAGFCCVINRGVFVHHHCSRTYQLNNMDYNKLLIEARNRLMKKHSS